MANPRRNSYSNNTENTFQLQYHSRLQHSSSSLSSSNLHEIKSSQEEDEKANLIKFKSGFLSSKDKRGWLLDPVSIALEYGIKGGAVSCFSIHVGEIKPGGVRGNHRHHTCNETIVIWGAKTLFRLENNQIVDKGYAEVIVSADEVAVAASPSGTAHAIVNMDRAHTAYILGCQDTWKMDEGKKRMAVLVGCNYPNTRNELHGCINDVLTMKEVLVKRFGFDLSHVQAEAGDVLFFHYSGHGTRIPSAKPGHPFRQDEAIVPCDFNLITDLDFRQLVNRLPKGASLTILSDSCHSGGLIDREKEQIGPNAATTNNNPKVPSHSPKAIPFESILQHLSSLTNISTSDIGTHFLEFFGSDASLKFRLPPLERDLFESINADEGILLSGCQANETSADMSPHEGGGRSYGAFSNAVQMVLKEHSGQLSNKQLVMMARDVLQAQGFEQQHPCLYCSDQNAGSTFLWQPGC
ncbi:hypothetical protein OIU84_011717 [Salix udensis]|uniref:Uncharacterized protein n=1 Tax=Salix udensis TaxID=889485 RepID=A0AAD6JNI6_9ROSI|nr:hypothetical protein OIU84_011717 [Salix udensis]